MPTSDAALWEYCDKYYHQLLPIIAEKVHQEKVQQEKLKEVKARLNFEVCSGRNSKIQEVSQDSESRTPDVRGDLRRRLRSIRSNSMSRSPEPNPSVFSRIRRERSESPRNRLGDKGRKEGGVFKRLGVKEEMCPHTRRAATKVPGQEERSKLPGSVTMKEHLHGERNHSQRVRIVDEDTGSQDRRSKSQPLRKTTYLNHGEQRGTSSIQHHPFGAKQMLVPRYLFDPTPSGSKLRNKNADEYWEIIENLALYDHEGWNDTKEFIKPVKAISTPQGISKTPDRRLLELEDQINFLLKGSRPTPRSSTHIPHAYADAVYSNPRPQSHNELPKLNPFTFRERTGPSPQPQALGTTFEARVRDYMAAHTERMERFENAIFKQREEINDRMTEMFGLLKELTTSRTPEKEERSDKTDETLDNTVKPTRIETKIPVKEAERNNETRNKPITKAEEEEVVEVLSSRPVEYYLKHRINEKLIKGLVDNNRFNDSLSRARVGKVKGKTYNVLPRWPVYEAILKKKITKKEDIGGNFEIPCSIGGLKHVNVGVEGFVSLIACWRFISRRLDK
ncbi:hypothetical protein Tco_1304829 [Tanacetum coccineum]